MTSAGRAAEHLPWRAVRVEMPTRLIQFLLARIADEEGASALAARRARTAPPATAPADGATVREQCDVKRRIIGEMQHELLRCTQPDQVAERDAALATLLEMARPYSSHLSFRPEWRTAS